MKQRIFADGDPQGTYLLQSTPTSGGQFFSGSDLFGRHQLLIKRSVNMDRFKAGIDNELSQDGVTSEMPFRGGHQVASFNLADDIAQVQVADRDVFDFVATDFAHVTLIALRHVVTTVDCEGWIDLEYHTQSPVD